MNLEIILKKLISFKTVTGNKPEIDRAFDFVKNFLVNLPITVKEVNTNSLYPSLFITTQKTFRPKLILVAHLDVVDGSTRLFKAQIKKTKLIGRGSFDMKYAIACYIKLFQELGRSISKYDIGIMITTDEEKGGFEGAKKMLQSGYGGNVCFLPDGGENWKLEIRAKGVWQFVIEVLGTTAHSSRPWKGNNAISRLITFLVQLESLFLKEPCGDPLHNHDTINIAAVHGGQTYNQIPDSAKALIDIRYTNKESLKLLSRKIKLLLKSFKGVSMIEQVCEPVFLAKKTPYTDLFYTIAAERFKIPFETVYSHGTSDARYFSEVNIPTIVTRPKGGGHHSDNEWIDLPDLNRFYEVLKKFVQSEEFLK